jgi:hypothetical protein
VKLLTSLFAPDANLIGEGLTLLSERLGKADFISAVMPFAYTDYYREEMGASLVRRFASFEGLVSPEVLPDVKTFANDVEDHFSSQGKRRINIDPGYLSEYHLILATGKGYAHRPYLRSGVHADLTLIYRDGAFHSLDWTYPDYASDEVKAVLMKIREKYILQLKKGVSSF